MVKRISREQVKDARIELDILKNLFKREDKRGNEVSALNQCNFTEDNNASNHKVNGFLDTFFPIPTDGYDMLMNKQVSRAVKNLPHALFSLRGEVNGVNKTKDLVRAMYLENVMKISGLSKLDINSGQALRMFATPPESAKERDLFLAQSVGLITSIAFFPLYNFSDKDWRATERGLKDLASQFEKDAKSIRDKQRPASLNNNADANTLRLVAASWAIAAKQIAKGASCDKDNPTKMPSEEAALYLNVAKALVKVAEAMHAREKAELKEKAVEAFNKCNETYLNSEDKRVKALGLYQHIRAKMYGQFQCGASEYTDNTISSMTTTPDTALLTCKEEEKDAEDFYGLARDPIGMLLKDAMLGVEMMCMPDKLDVKGSGGGGTPPPPPPPKEGKFDRDGAYED